MAERALRFDDIPPEALRTARRAILDTVEEGFEVAGPALRAAFGLTPPR
jgi:hypothetical protein